MNKIKYLLPAIILLKGNVFSNFPPIEIIDSMNNRIVISKEITKVVSLHGSISETVCALGQSEKLVAVTDSDTYPAILKRKIKIGRQMNPSIRARLKCRLIRCGKAGSGLLQSELYCEIIPHCTIRAFMLMN